MGQCVTDGIGIHGNNERCTILATADIYDGDTSMVEVVQM